MSRILTACIFALALAGPAGAQPLPKPRVADLIVKVENGVDEFRDYLKNRGENARSAASSSQAQARRARKGGTNETARAAANEGKDELDDALGDLNRSTNRLRCRFDATDAWMETRVDVDRMMDDGRKINQLVVRGNYGSQAARLWSVLRAAMNDLARAYGMERMIV